MKTKTNLRNIGGSTYILLPQGLADHLELKEGEDTVVIEDKKGVHGVFAVFWANKKEVEPDEKISTTE